ncbi:MAG TPA: FAD-dependent oxidoreductase, partial [Solirubrobacteraceae bacterium]|nr:FAD-dependent oxidoreductase [Solirubrobacteraceae bacterium]
VSIVHRRPEFRASKIMLERARAQENIEFLTPYTVDAFVAGENGALGHADLLNAVTGEELQIPVSGTFIAVGHEPQSALVAGQIDLDENGYVVTDAKSTRTNRPGVFAAGDLVDHTYRQAITAAGSGCEAALDAEWYLRDTPGMAVPAEMPAGDPAQAQWAPAQSAPAQGAPSQGAPAQSVPAQSVPAQRAPAQSAPSSSSR